MNLIHMFSLIGIMLLTFTIQASEIPEGWYKAGSDPEAYDFELDKSQGKPAPSAVLTSNESSEESGFGTLMQSFMPEEYLGKRVQLSAWVKTEDIKNWSGLWMRVDANTKKNGSFDNMQNRPIKGTSEWTRYSIVLEVSEDAKNLSYGFLIAGKGKAWFDNFEFSVVDKTVPTTGNRKRKKPINNSF